MSYDLLDYQRDLQVEDEETDLACADPFCGLVFTGSPDDPCPECDGPSRRWQL